MTKRHEWALDKSKTYLMTIVVFALVALGTVAFIGTIKNSDSKLLSRSDSNAMNAYAKIPKDQILFIGSDGDSAWNVNDPYFGYNKLPVVALVRIDTIDGGRNYSPVFGQYVYPQTVGKMTVLDVYKGDVVSGQTLNYSRLGGIVSYDDYWSGLNPEQRDKITYLNNGKKPSDKKYVQKKFSEDIDIEVGKKYLVFLLPQDYKDGSGKEYFIDGAQHGLREAKGNGKDITVFNNDTKQWDNINKIVKLK